MKNIRVIVNRTNKAIADQGYTYNEVGLTYNQIGVQYGGIYGQDIIPLIVQSRAIKPSIIQVRQITSTAISQRTNRLIAEQNYTYNEVGFTYNQSGVQYGGQYNYDIFPLISQARYIKPTNVLFGDTGITFVSAVSITLGRGMLVGMLGMTYSADIVVNQ